MMTSERTPLRGNEYAALQTLFAIVSGFTGSVGWLEKRARAAGCWEDMGTVKQLAESCMQTILNTVPEKKLEHIQKDLQHIKLYIRNECEGLPSRVGKAYSYTPTETLNDLLNYLCQHECAMCDKTPVEARKCPHRAVIDKALPHEVDGKDREHCKYSDMVLGLEG